MKLIVVESGSKGNATLVLDEGRLLLIDMGVTLTALKNALKTTLFHSLSWIVKRCSIIVV